MVAIFEEMIDWFIKGYEMKKADLDSQKYYEEEIYSVLCNKTFGLKLGNVVNQVSKTKNRSHDRYYLIKESIERNIRGMCIST
jgi:hypothetical protein